MLHKLSFKLCLSPLIVIIILFGALTIVSATETAPFDPDINAPLPEGAIVHMKEDFEGDASDYNQNVVNQIAESVKGQTSTWKATEFATSYFGVTPAADRNSQVIKFSTAKKGSDINLLNVFFQNTNAADTTVVKYRYKLETSETGDFLFWFYDQPTDPQVGANGNGPLHRMAVFHQKIVPQAPDGNQPDIGIIPGSWNDIAIVFYHDNGVYDLFVNNQQKVKAAKIYKNAAINKLIFGHNRTFSISIDDILVYTDTQKRPDQRIQADFDAIQIPDIVTDRLEMKSTGSMGSVIKWHSSAPTVISSDGNVKPDVIPTYVSLTATLSNADQTMTYQKIVYVPAQTPLYQSISNFVIDQSSDGTDHTAATLQLGPGKVGVLHFDVGQSVSSMYDQDTRYVVTLKAANANGGTLALYTLPEARSKRMGLDLGVRTDWNTAIKTELISESGAVTGGDLLREFTSLTDGTLEIDVTNFLKRQPNGTLDLLLTGSAMLDISGSQSADAPTLRVERPIPIKIPDIIEPNYLNGSEPAYGVSPNGGTYTVKTSYANMDKTTKNISLITALFDTSTGNPVFTDVKISSNKIISPGTITALENDIIVPEGSQTMLKSFIWEDTESLSPLCAAKALLPYKENQLASNDRTDTTSICEIKDNKKAIWTFTADDSLIASDEYFSEHFTRLGLRGSFAMIVQPLLTDPSLVPRFQALFDKGNFDITNHSYDHKTNPQNRPDDEAHWQWQINDAKDKLEDLFPEEKVFTVANPWVQTSDTIDAIISKENWAARNGKNTSTDYAANNNTLNPTEYEWFHLSWQHGNSSCTLERMKGWVDAALRDGTWILELWHGVKGTVNGQPFDEGSSPVNTAVAEPYFEYVASKKDELWIATFNEATAYLREKQQAEYQVLKMTDDSFRLTLTHNLPPELFDEALTMQTRVDSSWQSAEITQDGNTIIVPTTKTAESTYLIYDVYPNKGEVAINRIL